MNHSSTGPLVRSDSRHISHFATRFCHRLEYFCQKRKHTRVLGVYANIFVTNTGKWFRCSDTYTTTNTHTYTHTHTRTRTGFIVEKHQILCYAKKRLSFFHDSPNIQLRFCRFITAVYHSFVNMCHILRKKKERISNKTDKFRGFL